MAVERFFKFLLGAFLILLCFYLLLSYWTDEFLILLKGSIPLAIFLIGLVFILLSLEK